MLILACSKNPSCVSANYHVETYQHSIFILPSESTLLLLICLTSYNSLVIKSFLQVCINVGDNLATIWSLSRDDERWSVCHAEPVTCCAITSDSLYLVTGSKDMSLKVWQINGGKLAQVGI